MERIIRERWLEARARFAILPANSVGDDIEIFNDLSGESLLASVHTLRQQMQRNGKRPNLALADYIAPKESGLTDYLGFFVVTAGIGLEVIIERMQKEHNDYQIILLKALADRLAEAFAELLHARVRKEFWGYASDEKLNNDQIIAEEYRGIRPAPGYPACPDHTEKEIIFDLLQAEKAIGVKLTESMAMQPAASVSGYYFAHPKAQYFGVGKIGMDQLIDYARRKGKNVETMKRWLSSILLSENA